MCVGGICVCVFAIFDCIELPQFNFASQKSFLNDCSTSNSFTGSSNTLGLVPHAYFRLARSPLPCLRFGLSLFVWLQKCSGMWLQYVLRDTAGCRSEGEHFQRTVIKESEPSLARGQVPSPPLTAQTASYFKVKFIWKLSHLLFQNIQNNLKYIFFQFY